MYVQNILVTKLNYTGAKRQKLLFYANKEIHFGIVEEIEFGQFVATFCQIDFFFVNAFFFYHLNPLTSICNFLLKE